VRLPALLALHLEWWLVINREHTPSHGERPVSVGVRSASIFPAPMTARARNAKPPRWQASGAFGFVPCFGSW
jgi:hypothetical protein